MVCNFRPSVNFREGAAEGGCGGNSAAPERRSPAAPPEYLQGETEQKFPFPFLNFFQRDARKRKIVRENFCEVAAGALAEAGGGAGQFASKKVRAKDIISPQTDTSSFERIAPRGREAVARRKKPRRFAAKMKGAEKEKRADLSLFRI